MADGNFKDNWPLSVALILVSLALILSNLHWVNLSVKFYDQMDVIPIYQAFSMITEMLCGLIIGDEFNLYTGTELLALLLSSMVTLGGILVLTMKSS